jgi:hypothetical protein
VLLHHLVAHGVAALNALWREERHCETQRFLDWERDQSSRLVRTRTNKATAFGDTQNLKMHGQSNIQNAARAGKANNKLVKESRDRLLLEASAAM